MVTYNIQTVIETLLAHPMNPLVRERPFILLYNLVFFRSPSRLLCIKENNLRSRFQKVKKKLTV